MASAIEALGMSLPYSSSNPALSEDKKKECVEAGKAIKILLEKNNSIFNKYFLLIRINFKKLFVYLFVLSNLFIHQFNNVE